MTATASKTTRRAFTLLALVVAGEAIFTLPFVLARVFRPTVLDVFGLTNLELGTAFSVYGVVAMLAYFPGGLLADRFRARTMMTLALVLTAAGGLLLGAVPALPELRLLYGFWGFSTILLFWAAMIRATRAWGGPAAQGAAFGLLDGGRGLFAALLATGAVALFAMWLPGDAAEASLEARTYALQGVIGLFSVATALAGLLVFALVPDDDAADRPGQRYSAEGFRVVLGNPRVWLLAAIVLAAYVGYKGMDDLPLLARDIYGYDDVQAASISTLAFWVRPIAALGAGLLGDRVGGLKGIALCFTLLVVGDGLVAAGVLQPSAPALLIGMVVAIGAGVFGLRGLYFAVFAETGVPLRHTGTAVGLVSAMGFLPDIFMGPLHGYLTDTYPGALGHRLLFAVLCAAAVLGLVATLLLRPLPPTHEQHANG